jgi:site-specific DNA recombinase
MVKGKKKAFFYLQTNEEEIKTVKFIFDLFLKERSLKKIVSYFATNEVKTKNGKEYAITTVRDILANPVYCTADGKAQEYFLDLGCQVCIDETEWDNKSGLISYAKTSGEKHSGKPNPTTDWIIAKGKHDGLISGEDFVNVQKSLLANKPKGEAFSRIQSPYSLLSGVLYCTCDHAMRPKNYRASIVNERGERTFAYVCLHKNATHGRLCHVSNVHGNTMDYAICEALLAVACPDNGMIPLLEGLKKNIMDSDGSIVDESTILSQELCKKKAKIGKLVSALSGIDKQNIAAQYIADEITSLDRECKQLEKKIANYKKKVKDEVEATDCIDELVNLLSDFRLLFSTLGVNRKREFIRKFVKKVVWDGESAHIYSREQ